MSKETITLGGGCFWCVEAVFDELKGVTDVVSGYMGGQVKNPSYEAVCTGSTGHAEVIQVVFDPAIVSLEQILDVFFLVHDPTTLNRQGADIGTQYRSVIFYHNAEQQRIANERIAAISAQGLWANPIVTEVSEVSTFYPAEAYHQNYFADNPDQGYCRVVVAPKVAKFRKHYFEMLKQ